MTVALGWDGGVVLTCYRPRLGGPQADQAPTATRMLAMRDAINWVVEDNGGGFACRKARP
jgi:hypothetical protein